MANRLIEIELPNKSTVLARVDAIDGGGAEKTGSLRRFDFDEIGETLEGLALAIKGGLEKAAPDKVTVELALELAMRSGKLSGILVEGEGKGSLSVTLEWAGEAPAP